MPPKVLIVGNFLSAYGLSRGVCEELAPRLVNAGLEVVCTSNRRSKITRLADMLYTVWKYRKNYDVAQVDVYSGQAFLWAEAVCRLLQQVHRPYVLTLHGGGLPQFALKAQNRVVKLLNSAAAVTVPSPYLLDQMRPYRSNLTLVPNGLDLRKYVRRTPLPLRPRLIWLRAFHEIYNPVMAVRVAAQLRDEFPDLLLTMVGPDKHDSTLEETRAEIARNGIEKHIQIQGYVEKSSVPDLLKTGDIFLNTSNFDNTPVSVLEAMASGLCVVSTDAGGLPYMLQANTDALLVPINDHSAMAHAVRRLLTDECLVQRIQSAAAQKVCGYDWEIVLPRWLSLLSSIAQTPPGEREPFAYTTDRC